MAAAETPHPYSLFGPELYDVLELLASQPEVATQSLLDAGLLTTDVRWLLLTEMVELVGADAPLATASIRFSPLGREWLASLDDSPLNSDNAA